MFQFVARESDSIAVGERFVRELREKCHKLAALETTIGRDRSELQPGIRSFPYKNYVIFFRYIGARFEVVNILERHRDVETHFRGEHER